MRRELAKYFRLPTANNSATGAASPRRPALIGGLLIFLMLLTGLGWAVSSPVQGSPDEDYHLGSIWCPRPAGGSCAMDTVNGKPVVRVPIAVADGVAGCYIFKSTLSAGCVPGYDDSEMGWSARFDNDAYPFGYYHFHHLFIGQDVQTSVLVMRGVNVLIAVALLGTVGFCAPQRLKRPLIGAVAASWIPMGVYFISSVNPSSWAISGLLVYTSALYLATRQEGRSRGVLMLCAVIGAVMCLTSRYDAAFFLLVVGIALLFGVRWTRRRWPELCVLVGAAVVGSVVFTSSSQTSKVAYFSRVANLMDSAIGKSLLVLLVVGLALIFAVRRARRWWRELCVAAGVIVFVFFTFMSSLQVSRVSIFSRLQEPAHSADEQSFVEKLIIGIETAPKYLGGFWGHAWSPGWYDVPLQIRSPHMLAIMAAGAFVAVSLRRGGWRKWVALAVLVMTMIGLPAVFYANGAMNPIEEYQARYIFPMLAPTFFLMLAIDQDEKEWFTVPQAVWVFICGAVCQAISLHTLLMRYVHGNREPWELNLNKGIEWWWNVPVPPMTIWFLTTCVATAALGIAAAMLVRTADKQE